ncbi:MAG: hypothetical protein IPJ23_18470 [Ignavibacteriales bacterium]|nr:hypothetical protein [Ignavibacteriales bacterium]
MLQYIPLSNGRGDHILPKNIQEACNHFGAPVISLILTITAIVSIIPVFEPD